MKVKIRGIVRIWKDGVLIKEVENKIHFDTLAQILYQVLNNSPPSGTYTPSIEVLNNGTFEFAVPVTYSNFVWKGTLTSSSPFSITCLVLYATFNGYSFRASDVTTALSLPAGTYTIEWIWVVDDPVGFVKDILNFGFAGVYKSYSITAGTCTHVISITIYNNLITIFFVCLESTTTTYTNFTTSFDVINTDNTTYYMTTSLPFATKFKLTAPNTLIVPFTIELT